VAAGEAVFLAAQGKIHYSGFSSPGVFLCHGTFFGWYVVRVFYIWAASGNIPTINAFAAFSSFIAAAQFTLFAMWFDMEANKHLRPGDPDA